METATDLDSPGIYAWYYFPEFTQKDIENIVNKIQSDDSGEKENGVQLALDLIEKHFFKAYLYQSIWIAGSIGKRHLRVTGSGVTPKFEVRMNEVANDSHLKEKLLADPGLLSYWAKMIRQTMKGEFLSPIYVGKAAKQSLRKRLLTHAKEIDSIQADVDKIERPKREQWYNTKEKEYGKAGRSSFAVRVVRYRLNPIYLRIVARPINDEESRIGDLEHFINRVVRPPHGRK